MADSMIERVARAICQSDERHGEPSWDWYSSDEARSNYFDAARAAIEAMREPDMAMGRAMLSACEGKDPAPIAQVWYRMIDAALAPVDTHAERGDGEAGSVHG